jgi:photosystem II stability/assembly factor-like uncharacterized protein
LFRTLDGGGSWTSIPNSLGLGSFTSASDGSVIAIGDGIYRTNDDGTTWTRMGELPECSDVNVIAVSPSDPLELLAGTAEVHGFGILCGGVYRSVDAGQTWEQTLPGRDVREIAFDVTSPSRVFASSATSGPASNFPYGAVLESDDGGSSWRELASLQVSDLPASLALSSSGRTLYAAPFYGDVIQHRFRRPILLEMR